MPYLLSGDLDTDIYPEDKEEIVRMDSTIIYSAINTAISKAKKYLGRFDLIAIFGTDLIEPTYEDEDLKSIVKAIAVWRLVKLGCPNINVEMARTCYEDAIADLLKMQSGKASAG